MEWISGNGTCQIFPRFFNLPCPRLEKIILCGAILLCEPKYNSSAFWVLSSLIVQELQGLRDGHSAAVRT